MLSLQTRCYSSRKAFDPLRILFCGADEFSIHSLRKLNSLKLSSPDVISCIDVVCRPDKAVGRRRQQIREVPIKSITHSLGLNLHQIDTFTNWTPPPADLLITVSFGLLVPARILEGARYGGINIHPSLLPDLRGPAPIQHALLQRRKMTGVSIQTMHPTQFDRGAILAQNSVNVPEAATVASMVDLLGQMGAKMLVEGIENGLFVEPKEITTDVSTTGELRHAPKITPQDRKIEDWKSVTAGEILRRDRVLGKLWDEKMYGFCCSSEMSKRVTYQGGWDQFVSREVQIEHRIPWETDRTGGAVIFRIPGVKGLHFGIATTESGVLLAPSEATIEGEKKGQGLKALINGIKARM